MEELFPDDSSANVLPWLFCYPAGNREPEAGLFQLRDEKPLVIVLWVYQCKRIRADAVTEIPETELGYLVRADISPPSRIWLTPQSRLAQ